MAMVINDNDIVNSYLIMIFQLPAISYIYLGYIINNERMSTDYSRLSIVSTIY